MTNKTGKLGLVRWLLIGVLGLLVWNFSTPNAQGLNPEAPDVNVDGNLGLARCVQQGNIDFTAFINAVIASDGLVEGLIEPWNDVLRRNQCQTRDVLGLINQRDKIRSSIRDAFLLCKSEDVADLRKAFHKTGMELYYVRHIVDGKVVLSLPYSSLSTRQLEDEESLYADTEKLNADMRDRFVDNNLMSESEFNEFFEKLQKKYADRKSSYVQCESSSWDQVSDKWDEFITDIGGTNEAWQNLEDGVKDEAQSIAGAAEGRGLKEYLSGIVGITLNNLEPEAGFEDILKNTEQYGLSGGPVTQDDIFTNVLLEERRYETDSLRNEMAANFQVLYKDTGDESIKLIVDELTRLNQVLTDSVPELDKVLSCTKTINNRQCPGN